MEYRLGVLTGQRLDEFLEAIDWDVLEPHYEAVASDPTHRTSRRYARSLENLKSKNELWFCESMTTTQLA